MISATYIFGTGGNRDARFIETGNVARQFPLNAACDGAWVVKRFALFSEAVGKTRWSGRVRSEQGPSPASLREV